MKPKSARELSVAIVAIVVLATAGSVAAVSKTYHFGVSDQRTNITFESKTDFEIILGSTNKIRGSAEADFASGKANVRLEVPVASLRTGIDLRDEHLRSAGWLDASKHPSITFVSKKSRKLDSDRWEVSGDFTMHGVTRTVKTVADVRAISSDLAKKAGLEAGEWLRVSAPFEIKLSDFGVKIPDMAAAKVNDAWKVRVVAFASNMGGSAANPCGGKKSSAHNPCGGKAEASNPCNPCGEKKK